MNHAKKALVLTILIALSLYAYVALQEKMVANATGQLYKVNVNIYRDQDGATELTVMDFGVLAPGETKAFVAYVESKSSGQVTLSYFTSNWVPANASQFITLAWDYNGISIQPNHLFKTTFTLKASPSISGIDTFTFLITVLAQKNRT